MKTKSTIKFASPVFIMQFVVLIHTWLTCTINPKRSSLVAIMVLSMCMVSFGANRYSVATGNWSSTSTWSATSGGAPGASVPTAGYFVYIEGGYTVTLDANAPAAGALRLLSINTGSELKTTAAYTVNATTITVNGYYFNGSTGTITGTMSVNNGATYEHAVDNA
ncbi:MAG: hypothetical protein ABR968_12090, partial [Bacteroidales bacterium]